MAGFKNFRKFKIRTQRRDSSRTKPARVGLVTQRRIVVNGNVVTVGARAATGSSDSIKAMVATPKIRQIGEKQKKTTNKNLKVGKKWPKTAQASRKMEQGKKL